MQSRNEDFHNYLVDTDVMYGEFSEWADFGGFSAASQLLWINQLTLECCLWETEIVTARHPGPWFLGSLAHWKQVGVVPCSPLAGIKPPEMTQLSSSEWEKENCAVL